MPKQTPPPATRLADYFCVVGSAAEDCKAAIVERYSRAEHKDFALPKELPLFVFPNGLVRRSTPLQPRFATFVLTRQSGKKIFSSFLIFFERDRDEGGGFVSKALCILSCWPYYRGFEQFLRRYLHINGIVFYRLGISALARHAGNVSFG